MPRGSKAEAAPKPDEGADATSRTPTGKKEKLRGKKKKAPSPEEGEDDDEGTTFLATDSLIDSLDKVKGLDCSPACHLFYIPSGSSNTHPMLPCSKL